jgi:hypothetical protein
VWCGALCDDRGVIRGRARAGLLIVVLVSGWALGGCQGNGEQIRATLAAREASWQREIDTLKSQKVSLRSRVDGQPPGPAVRRARTTIGGIGQSLVDVEIQMRQIGPRVEKAISAGSDDASKALEEESGRMNGYLEALEGDLTSAEQELHEIGRSEPAKRAQAE